MLGYLPMKRVEKGWGHEIWITNGAYCGKILALKKGFRCSVHHHKLKDETFYVTSGRVLMELGDEKAVMVAGQSLLIPPNKKHRFTGLEDSEIFEFSTHHEDSDSYRDEESGEVDLSTLDIPEEGQ